LKYIGSLFSYPRAVAVTFRITSEVAVVTDYRGLCRTLLPVKEVKLKGAHC